MDAALVRADEHPPLPDLPQVRDGTAGLLSQPKQPRAVLEEHLAGVGQRPVARRPVDQPLACRGFQPPDGLADGRLGPVELPRRPRKAPLGGHRDEYAKVLEGHHERRGRTGRNGPIFGWSARQVNKYSDY